MFVCNYKNWMFVCNYKNCFLNSSIFQGREKCSELCWGSLGRDTPSLRTTNLSVLQLSGGELLWWNWGVRRITRLLSGFEVHFLCYLKDSMNLCLSCFKFYMEISEKLMWYFLVFQIVHTRRFITVTSLDQEVLLQSSAWKVWNLSP